jgi:hypothetical protein
MQRMIMLLSLTDAGLERRDLPCRVAPAAFSFAVNDRYLLKYVERFSLPL